MSKLTRVDYFNQYFKITGSKSSSFATWPKGTKHDWEMALELITDDLKITTTKQEPVEPVFKLSRSEYFKIYYNYNKRNTYWGVTWPKGSTEHWERAYSSVMRQMARDNEFEKILLADQKELEKQVAIQSNMVAEASANLYYGENNLPLKNATYIGDFLNANVLLPTRFKQIVAEQLKIDDLTAAIFGLETKYDGVPINKLIKSDLPLLKAHVTYKVVVSSDSDGTVWDDSEVEIKMVEAEMVGKKLVKKKNKDTRYPSFFYNGDADNLNFAIEEHYKKYSAAFQGVPNKIVPGAVEIKMQNENVYYTPVFENGELIRVKDPHALHIDDPRILEFKNDPKYKQKSENCAIDFLANKYKKISVKNMNILMSPDKEGFITVAQIKLFCDHYRINCILYNFVGTKILVIDHGENVSKSYGRLNMLVYNNHVYPLKEKWQRQLEVGINKEIVHLNSDQIQVLMHKTLLKKILPNNIVCDDRGQFIQFSDDQNLYLANSDYKFCQEFIEEVTNGKQVKFTTNIHTVAQYLESYYIGDKLRSIWPCSDNFTKTAFNWCCGLDNISNEIIKVDKNKSYSHALKSLEYLPVINLKHNAIKIEKQLQDVEIVDHYLYTVTPEISTICLPDANIYMGFVLKVAKNYNLNAMVHYCQEADKAENHYKKMVEDVYNSNTYKKYPKDCKLIINCMIGKFHKGAHEGEEKIKFVEIANEEETKYNMCGEKFYTMPLKLSNEYDEYEEQEFTRVDLEYNLIYEKYLSSPKEYTKKPLAIAVMDYARMVILNKLETLDIPFEHIYKVSTDSITMHADYIEKFKFDDSLDGWKLELPTYKKTACNYNDVAPDFHIHPVNNTLVLGNAGMGKTHEIINKIVPLMREKKESHIVLAVTHISLQEYRENNIECATFESMKMRFTSTGKKAKRNYKYYIVDEIGLCGYEHWELLYKLSFMGKIICYGDFTQLQPIDGCNMMENGRAFLNYFFEDWQFRDGNYRNKLPVKYYDFLRHEYYNCAEEVAKFNTPIDQLKFDGSQFIITYRKSIAEKYNKMIMEKLGLNEWSDDLLIMCKSNDFKHLGIYNKSIIYFRDIKGKITDKQYENNFVPAYAVNIHNIQSQTLNNYYFAEEDYTFLNNRTTYTIISRLRGVTLNDC